MPSTWNALDFLVVAAGKFEPRGVKSAPAAVLRPVDGDILIRRGVRPRGPCTVSRAPGAAIRRGVRPRGPCTVSRAPGAADGIYGNYDGAMQQADAMVKQAGVNLWYTEDHHMFRTLRSYRDALSSA